MSLRPRYSLLTLLVLTAFVAGGVKLWYGPHHVVEREGNTETEYTYTRNWPYKKIIAGPVVHRQFEDEKLVYFYVGYFRNGLDCDWMISFDFKHSYQPSSLIQDGHGYCPLTDQEELVFQRTLDEELQRQMGQGFSYKSSSQGIPLHKFPGLREL